ncbi:unnamed protein product [Echinostoma caproni]|uniref:Tetraspanin n=1 Tax=Echinostoma caproni TaxID=27848 RepID=A0A183AQ10_9TREM|nr:unnamed protein product [Echinostoma caproni]
MAESSLQTFGESKDTAIGGMVIAVICMGSIIFLIGFLGFCGACLKSACMLILYGVLLGILTIGLIAGGIAGLVLRQEGCEEAFGKFLQDNLVVIAISIFVIAFVQIMCMVFAVCIIRAINNDDSQTA